MRRRQKEKWKKVLVLVCGTLFLVFGLRALSGLAQSALRQLVPEGEGLSGEIGEGILLTDRPLFSYLRFQENERGPFRFILERVLDHSRYILAAVPETDMAASLWDTKKGNENTGRKGEAGQTNERADAGEGVTQGDELVQVTQGLLESVMSENAAYGDYLPISYAKGEVEAATKPSKVTDNLPAESLPTETLPGEGLSGQKNPLEAKLLLENNYCIPDLANPDYLISKYYIVDSITSTLPELFNGKEMLSKDLSIAPAKEGGYQILIYHTHASEGFCDSRKGEVMDTVRGPGEALAEYLRGFGYTVYHDMTAYDRKDGKDNRNAAYSTARPEIEAFLEEHPEVEVIIDLHRDSGSKRVATVNGKKTAQIMLFNGLCRNASGPIDYLPNPNLSGNLAFSLQTNLIGRVLYPDLMFRIYLKNYRYNQHFRERCMLIELGTDQNTVEEAYNAMEPLANILDMVLRQEDRAG